MLAAIELEGPSRHCAAVPVPHVRLCCERMLIDVGSGLGSRFEEIAVPVVELSFAYAGVRVAADDPRERVFIAELSGIAPIERDRAHEQRARYLLESFGAVEIRCLDTHEPPFDSQATYLVHLSHDVHAYCAFSSCALPQLRKLGFSVEVAPDYPYQTLDIQPEWYGALQPTADHCAGDWFDLELGVEIDGVRIDLLGALVALLDDAPKSASLERLLQSTRQIALPIAEHRYLSVPREQIALILDVLRDLYAGAVRDVEVRREQCVDLVRLREALPQGKAARFTHALLDEGERMRAPAPLQVPPSGLQAELRPYQAAGLAWLQRLRASALGGVLADDMGLGKTLQTIAHILCEKQARRLSNPALIVAPTSLVGNWSREIARFAPALRVRVLHGPERKRRLADLEDCDVVITTYPLLVRELAALQRTPFHLLVLDEAQFVKNPRSQAHRAVRSLQAKHRLCLTGTPIENDLGELWALFDFLMPDFLGSAAAFRSNFRIPIEQEGNARRLSSLRARTAPFILRRMKDEVARELPAKTELLLPVELDRAQRDLYESIRVAAHADVRAAIRKKGLRGSTLTILDALMKLRQVCCDPRLVAVEAAEQVKESAKYDLMMQLLERQLSQGHRILVFSQFTSMLSLIEAGARAKGMAPLMLTGATRERQRLIDAFAKGQSDLFLISLKAGGTGLNLVGADTVIHYDPWWNPAAHAQATDRAHRLGQTKPVFVHNLIVAGSVEERMLRLQDKKRRLAATLLGPAPDAGLQLSEEQVDQLFAPLPPRD